MAATVRRTIKLTSPYMQGDDVRAVQLAARERLKARGLSQFMEEADGVYGPKSRAMMRQVIYYYVGGDLNYFAKHGLTKDYQKLIRLKKRRTPVQLVRYRKRAKELKGGQAKKALDFMRKNIGVRNRNANPVRAWCREAGYSGGVPWCGVAIIKALRAAGLKVENSWGFGYVPNIYYAAKRGSYGYRVVSQANAKPGDLVLYKWPGNGSDVADHAGFVETVSGGKVKLTLEGNTSGSSGGSQANGDSLQRKDRNGYGIVLIVRPPYAS